MAIEIFYFIELLSCLSEEFIRQKVTFQFVKKFKNRIDGTINNVLRKRFITLQNDLEIQLL